MNRFVPRDEGEYNGCDIEQTLRRLSLQLLGGENLLQRHVRAEDEVEALQDGAVHQVVETLGDT